MASFKDLGNRLYTGEKSFDFVGKRKLWYLVSASLILLSVLLPITRGGFNLGIEFMGGSEFRVSQVADQSETLAIDTVLSVVPEAVVSATKVGTSDLRIQTDELQDVEAEAVRVALADAFGIPSENVASSFIGPNWGADVTSQAINGLVIFLIVVSVLMAVYFRSWKMSVAALVALANDLVVTAGVYGAVGFEVTPAAVIGFLTILSYSLYDTVVVFDKVRENTLDIVHSETRTFRESVNLAVNQTLVRSINTSVVAVLPVAAILFIGSLLLGAGTLRDISLALFVGTIIGTFSSIFIAAPLYVHLREREAAIMAASEKVMSLRN